MNLDLTGRTAVVCGSTQGLGLASAIELSLLGANIVLLSRNVDKLKEVIGTLDTSKGQSHQYLVADFIDPANVEQAITGFLKNNSAQILINNTGGPAGGTALQAKPDEFRNA